MRTPGHSNGHKEHKHGLHHHHHHNHSSHHEHHNGEASDSDSGNVSSRRSSECGPHRTFSSLPCDSCRGSQSEDEKEVDSPTRRYQSIRSVRFQDGVSKTSAIEGSYLRAEDLKQTRASTVSVHSSWAKKLGKGHTGSFVHLPSPMKEPTPSEELPPEPKLEEPEDFEPLQEEHIHHAATTRSMKMGRTGVSYPTDPEAHKLLVEAELEMMECRLRSGFDLWLDGLRAMQTDYLSSMEQAFFAHRRLDVESQVVAQGKPSAIHGRRRSSELATLGPSTRSGSSDGWLRTSTVSKLSNTGMQRMSIDTEDTKRRLEARQKSEESGAVPVRTSIFDVKRDTLAQRFVASSMFQLFIFFLISSNAIVVGIEVDFDDPQTSGTSLTPFKIIDLCYTAMFLMELVMRLLAEGGAFFTKRGSRLWNVFDLTVVTFSVFEALAGFLATSGMLDMSQIRAVRVIRVTRLLRTFRMVRVAKSIHSLRTLLHSIAVSMKSLGTVVLLIVMIFYGFGIAFTQAVHDHFDGGYARLEPEYMPDKLKAFWGTLPRSMFTLFKAIAGGISWHEVVLPLSDVGWFWVALFCLFVVLSVFAILNVVTGVFCQSAMESAQNDKDLATAQMMADKDKFRNSMRCLFQEIDQDGSGVITLGELEETLNEDRSLAYLTSLGIESHDVWTLFKLLDKDGSGTVDMSEFISGCSKLKGDAKAVHIAKLSYDHDVLIRTLDIFMDSVDAKFEKLLKSTKEAKRHAADASKAASVAANSSTSVQQRRSTVSSARMSLFQHTNSTSTMSISSLQR